MGDSNTGNKGSFWTSLPGILTGVAALITAMATLFAVFPKPPSQSGGNEGSSSTTEPSTSLPSNTSPVTNETVSVAGLWNWEGVGAVTLQQNGTEVTGLVNYTNGHQAAFSGNLTERELTLTWWFLTGSSRGSLEDPQGNGTLSLSEDGLVLEGEFRNTKQNQGSYPWLLRRISS